MSARDVPAGQPLHTTALADFLDRDQIMDPGIRSLWAPVPGIGGPAFTVRCPRGDNLMLHAAIYRAEPGSVIVVESGDLDYALAGGNVCAVAQRRGVAGFVLDGLIRDLGEVSERGFPVFARGVTPKPGSKSEVTELLTPVRCGGVLVSPSDLVVADKDGVVVVPHDHQDEIVRQALAKADQEDSQSLDDWETAHRARLDQLLSQRAAPPRPRGRESHAILAMQSREDTDLGWGERPESADERLCRERPPHW